MKRLVQVLAACVMVSCAPGELCPDRECGDGGGGVHTRKVEIVLSGGPSECEVKSVLGGASIEKKVTDVSLASYTAEGRLLDTGYWKGDLSEMTVSVDGEERASVYVLVNMGDMTDAFPDDEDDISSLSWRLESYDRMVESGIPMCGWSAVDGSLCKILTVSVERLLAKVKVRIMHDALEGSGEGEYAYNMCNRSLYVRQANSLLRPFSPEGSRAESAEDIMPLSDHVAEMNDRDAYDGALDISQLGPGPGYFLDTTFVFYVPENMQGTILPEDEDSGTKDLCTFMEFNARRENNGTGYSGDVIYRYHIGKDNVSDFNIERNRVYEIALRLTEGGLFSDSWEVTKGDDWTDTRTLRFLYGPYVIYPGQKVKVMVHYNRMTAAETSSQPLPQDWRIEADGQLVAEAGLSMNFDPSVLQTGENGYSDFCIEFSASESAVTGAVIPLKVSTWDGSICDCSSITVAPLGEMIPCLDFQPEYVSQTAVAVITGVPQAKLPVSPAVEKEGIAECIRINDTTFRINAVGVGKTEISFSNSDDSRRCGVSLDIRAPRLRLKEGLISLNPDGEAKVLEYSYLDDAGNVLSGTDPLLYEQYLSPAVSEDGYLGGNVSGDRLHIYVSRLYDDDGTEIPLDSYDLIEIGAAGCPGVVPCSRMVYISDPFEGITEKHYGRVDDYTLFAIADTDDAVKDYFASDISANASVKKEMPVPEASVSSLSAVLEPLWTDGYSGPNEVFSVRCVEESGKRCWKVQQNPADVSLSHSAGLHQIRLEVENRHCGERISCICGTMDVYVHAALGAHADFGYLWSEDTYLWGITAREIYNDVAGTSVYHRGYPGYICYMDVSVDFLTDISGVRLLAAMRTAAAGYGNAYDAMDMLVPEKEDGSLDGFTSLLYSVAYNDPPRLALGEQGGSRAGVGNLLYRALSTKMMTTVPSQKDFRELLLGEWGNEVSAGYSPAYVIRDMNKSSADRNEPFHYLPSAMKGYCDRDSQGYHVIHFLDCICPSTNGWDNLL